MAKAYVTIGFTRKGRSLAADQPKLSKTPEAAIAAAKRIMETRIGVVAFEQTHDVESESYDDPVILFKHGELPGDFMGD